MNKYLLLLLILFGAIGVFAISKPGTIELDDNPRDDDRYYTDESQSNVYWIGPGYYGGIRFNDEQQFNVWKRTWSNDSDGSRSRS